MPWSLFPALISALPFQHMTNPPQKLREIGGRIPSRILRRSACVSLRTLSYFTILLILFYNSIMGEHISLDEQYPLPDSASAVNSAPAPKRRKKLRKGTVSCWECKRRKAKCVFSDDLGICDSCKRRGTDCVSQESERPPEVGSNKHIVDRLGEVEALVQHLLKNAQSDKRSRNGLASPSRSVSRRQSEDGHRHSRSPAAVNTNAASTDDASLSVSQV